MKRRAEGISPFEMPYYSSFEEGYITGVHSIFLTKEDGKEHALQGVFSATIQAPRIEIPLGASKQEKFTLLREHLLPYIRAGAWLFR